MQKNYYAQLDGLRALAAVIVVFAHVIQPLPKSISFLTGTLSVSAFFVLSGFLITGILLRLRDSGAPLGASLYSFTMRRTLRIFPLYFSAVLLAPLVVENFFEELPWYLTFTFNWYVYLKATWIGLGHLWTLGVEQQFYWLWPFVILLLPARFLLPALISLTMAGFLSRFVLMQMGVNYVQMRTSTPANLDSLVAGALLATLLHLKLNVAAQRLEFVALIGSLILVPAGIAVPFFFAESGLRPLVQYAAATALGTYFVCRCHRGVGGPIGSILQSSPLVYLGTISYGIYVWHEIVRKLLRLPMKPLVDYLNSTGLYLGWMLSFTLVLLVTIAVSAISWSFMEKPLNDFKDRFPYPKGPLQRTES
jgi:peptidoglycan/LPS O-acetylase OafA/YrhL